MQPLVDEALCEQLKRLDRGHHHQELSQALQLLPEIVADPYQGFVAYLRGKLALHDGKDDQAIQYLCDAVVELQPGERQSLRPPAPDR